MEHGQQRLDEVGWKQGQTMFPITVVDLFDIRVGCGKTLLDKGHLLLIQSYPSST